jgi:signal transduction histidine kinase
MPQQDVLERLAALKGFDAVPGQELEWLASHGTLQTLEVGEVLTAKAERVRAMYVLLSGRLAISVDRGAGRHKVMEWHTGDATGLLPYSRLVSPPSDIIAQERTTVLAIPPDCLREMTRECHEVTTLVVHMMLDRSRTFTTSGLHDEKMASLGKLAAGLAHELNNPAAAIERSAAILEERLEDAEVATRALGAARLSDEQLAAVDTVRSSCLATRKRGVKSPLEQAEREEAIADWLADHGLDTANAEALADTGVTFDALELIVGAVDRDAVNAVLKWAAAGCSVRGLASEIQEAATRIAGLVVAIKGFTHMDQAAVAEPVDVVRSLENTVAVLRSKARARSASVDVQTEPGLPKVLGFTGELNQVWANLIDNALDAIVVGGRVDVGASLQNKRVVVRIVDNGSGIPPDVRERIFDPFFTTKPVGQGTGLGLDIVRRLVQHNDGEISVESEPGRTEFRVELPVAEGVSAVVS